MARDGRFTGGWGTLGYPKSHQIRVFLIMGFFYGALHISRTMWSYSKTQLNETSYYNKENLGGLDTSFLTAYSIGLLFGGWISDRVNRKVYLIGGAILAMAAFAAFGYLEGVMESRVYILDTVLFLLNGLGQSVGWPSCLAVLGSWFSASERGFVVGLWGGNINVGNIMGYRIGGYAIDDEGWNFSVLTYFALGYVGLWVLLIALFVKFTPKDAGLENDEAVVISNPQDA